MSSDDIIALAVGGALAGAGVLLAAVCVWSRRGRSRRARWWVRSTPVHLMERFPPLEALGLVIAPVFAETLVAMGVLVGLGPTIARELSATLVPLAIALVLQFMLVIFARGMTAYRWVLPIWVYPAWLREQRRTDAAWLQEVRPEGYRGPEPAGRCGPRAPLPRPRTGGSRWSPTPDTSPRWNVRASTARSCARSWPRPRPRADHR